MPAVLFDLDGTLLNTGDLIIKSLSHAVTQTGFSTDCLEQYIWGCPLRSIINQLCPGREQQAFDAYQDHYQANRHLVTPYPGVLRMLDHLHDRGAQLAIVTTKTSAPARADLVYHGMSDRFPVFIGFNEVEYVKPHPQPVQMALKALGVAPEQAVMIGDTAGDIESGHAAGTLTGAVMWGPNPQSVQGHEHADVVFNSPLAIMDWYDKWTRG